MAQLNFNIEDVCGTLSENKDGWRKELTYISWNNRAPKFDLRSWDPDYQAMTKGIKECEVCVQQFNEMK